MTGAPDVRTAVLEPNLMQAPWRWLEEAHALAPAVLTDDRASDPTGGSRGGKPETYWMLFNQRQGAAVKTQLSRAGSRTAQLILLAWTLAGEPAAPKS